jgi:trehalose-6-phosphate synthase
MPLTERRQRHEQNYSVLVHNDITQWAERFLSMLEGPPMVADGPPVARAAAGR